jgi:uncharacterized protein (DUF4415 family)
LNSSSKTNWERVDALTDEKIDTSEIPPLSEDFFKRAKWRKPAHTVAVTIDEETLAWFRAQGKECDERLTDALQIYAKLHQK